MKAPNIVNRVTDDYITEDGSIFKFQQFLNVKYSLPNGFLSTHYCRLKMPRVQGLLLHANARVLFRKRFILLVNKHMWLFGCTEEQ